MTMKKSFGGLGKPFLEYPRPPAGLKPPEFVPYAGALTLLHPRPDEARAIPAFKIGDPVRTGQKLTLYGPAAGAYVTAPVTGRIASLAPFPESFGRRDTAVSLLPEAQEVVDAEFEAVRSSASLDSARSFLNAIPGRPNLQRLADAERPVQTLVVCGLDQDLLVFTQQRILQSRWAEIEQGIRMLKSWTGCEEVVILVRREAVQGHGHITGRVVEVGHRYPEALPALVMAQVFKRVVPAGRTCEDLGFCFMSAEAVASIGAAFATGRMPVTKTMTVVARDGAARLAAARIGTPVGAVLAHFNAAVEAGDRVVLGGPMRGTAVFNLEHPVQPDTDAIMVLGADRAAHVSDYPCTNCGECIRACPARMQVNLLIRYLEAGKFEEAEEYYDLQSCVECGLCSYVCVSKIPILQFIALAKHELARARQPESSHA